MKKISSFLLVLIWMLGLLSGCGVKKPSDDTHANGSSVTNSENAAPVEVDFFKTDGDMFTERDGKTDYDESRAVTIQLNGTTATASSDSVASRPKLCISRSLAA